MTLFSCFKNAPLWRHWPGGGQEGPGGARNGQCTVPCILTTEGSFLFHPRNHHAVYIILTFVVRYSTKQSALTEYLREEFPISHHHQLPTTGIPCLIFSLGSCRQAQKCLIAYRATCNNQSPGDLYTTPQNFFHLLRRLGSLSGSFWLIGLGFCFVLIHYTAGECLRVPILFVLKVGNKLLSTYTHRAHTDLVSACPCLAFKE